MPSPFASALTRVTVVASLLAVALPLPAQLGALRRAVEKKAADRVEQRVEDRSNEAMLQPPTFDATTVELTDAILDRWVAAHEAIRSQRASQQGGVDRLEAEAGARTDSALALERPDERRRFEQERDRYRQCETEVRHAADADAQRAQQALEARLKADPMRAMNDPQMQRLAEAMQAMAAAQARGDTAAARRHHDAFIRAAGGLDEAGFRRTVTTRCGAAPSEPRWMATQTALRLRADSSRAKAAREMRVLARPTGAALGVSDVAAAMVEERIMSFLAGMRPSAPITVRFTKAEHDRLVRRRGELSRARRGR
jgi:hypothetical protein